MRSEPLGKIRYALSGRWTSPSRDPNTPTSTSATWGKMDQDHNALVAQFCEVTGASAQDAQLMLAASQWNLDAAVGLHYASQEQDGQDDEGHEHEGLMEAEPQPEPVPQESLPSGGGRTLGGDGVPSRPAPASSSAPSSGPSQSRDTTARTGGKMRTLRDLQGEGGDTGHGHSHGHGRGEGDDEDSENDQDFFAGGEKSGLAVQNPKTAQDHIRNIINQAKERIKRPGEDDEEEPQSHFSGQGQTLGGDDTPSRIIPDPNADAPRRPGRVNRVLHLWRNGFSVDDGPLCRYDDPEHEATLRMINQGRAPLDILNVERGQEVDLGVDPRKEEDYQPPKKTFKPFSGSGQRLGSPTPGAGPSSSSAATATAPAASSGLSSAPLPAEVPIDESAPTIRLQIRLADGTNLRTRFNTTHTLNDIYRFVNSSNPGSSSRAYVLMTTFPNKDHADSATALSEVKELSRGGNIVQKWL
ncbi:MAG: hypothetical protein M1820_004695 [Bogoriella megaspora]|nr:MAG: hypothetical protein M1820_004695 [Bogoriella megaspora]